MTTEQFKSEYEQLKNILENNKGKYLKAVYGRFTDFYPRTQFITLDALNKEDWTNGISRNSVFLDFEIDFLAKKLEIHSSGGTYISEIDKQLPQYEHLALHHITHIAKVRQVKGLRKTSYKNIDDLAKKILTTFNNIMKEIDQYTEGYPYKQGKKSIFGWK